MRKLLTFILLFSITALWLSISIADAKIAAPQRLVTRIQDDARYILQRTSLVILRAQKVCKPKTQPSRGDGHHLWAADAGALYGLNRAVTLQEQAKDLYLQGMYQQSIDYSLDARWIALQSLELANPVVHSHNQENFQNEVDKKESIYWKKHQTDLCPELDINGYAMTEDASVSHFIKYDF